MIKVLVEMGLVDPYRVSFETLLNFSVVWRCSVIKGGPRRKNAVMSMPVENFKKIFKENPRISKYRVPIGAESFISSVKVKEIVLK